MDRFEETSSELMEMVCDRCRHLVEAPSEMELVDICDACMLQAALAAALSAEYMAGRAAAVRQIIKAVTYELQQ